MSQSDQIIATLADKGYTEIEFVEGNLNGRTFAKTSEKQRLILWFQHDSLEVPLFLVSGSMELPGKPGSTWEGEWDVSDPQDHPDLNDRTIFQSHSSDRLTLSQVLVVISELQ